jgi:hypothetical protein
MRYSRSLRYWAHRLQVFARGLRSPLEVRLLRAAGVGLAELMVVVYCSYEVRLLLYLEKNNARRGSSSCCPHALALRPGCWAHSSV